jgi:hypothetical protein
VLSSGDIGHTSDPFLYQIEMASHQPGEVLRFAVRPATQIFGFADTLCLTLIKPIV